MCSIIRKKERIKKHIHDNCELGKTTTLHEFFIVHSFKRDELYRVLDLLVDEAAIQWTSEDQVISLPLPEWYKREQQHMMACHLSALDQRQMNVK